MSLKTTHQKPYPASNQYQEPALYLIMAVWFGMFTGLAEVVLLTVKKLVLHHIIHLSPHVVWMAPLA